MHLTIAGAPISNNSLAWGPNNQISVSTDQKTVVLSIKFMDSAVESELVPFSPIQSKDATSWDLRNHTIEKIVSSMFSPVLVSSSGYT